MSSPRILFCSTELSLLYPSGGVGTYLIQAALALVRSGRFRVDLLCEEDRYDATEWTRATAALEESGIGLIGYARRHGPTVESGDWVLRRSFRVYQRLVDLQARNRYAAVEFPEWGAEGYWSLTSSASFSPRPRFIVRLHSPSREIAVANGEPMTEDLERLDRLERVCVGAADVVLSPSRFLMDWALERNLTAPSRVLCSPYPHCGLGPISADARPATGPRRVVYFGRLETRKGVTDLARAVRHLRDPKSIELVFVGADTDRAPGGRSMRAFLREELQDVCTTVFMEPLPHPHLFSWLAGHADVIVIPSRWENYPNALLEAAQLPCALVVSDAGGIAELLSDYGIEDVGVFRAGDVRSLAAQIESALSGASAGPAGCGERPARDGIRESSKRVRDQFRELYAQLCAHDR